MDLDPRVSDEETGLPPLGDIDDNNTIVVVAWGTSSGLVAAPGEATPEAVRFLHVRGLVNGTNPDGTPDWAQVFLAIPSEEADAIARALALTAWTEED